MGACPHSGGSTVIVDHLALDSNETPSTILFPIGQPGMLGWPRLAVIGYKVDRVERARRQPNCRSRKQFCRVIVDPPRRFAILIYYDLYLEKCDFYVAEVPTYRQLIGTGMTMALFRPQAGWKVRLPRSGHSSLTVRLNVLRVLSSRRLVIKSQAN